MLELSDQITRKFVDSIDLDDYEIMTDTGWHDVSAIHMTVEYERYVLMTESGRFLECADDHIVFTDNLEQIFVKDCTPRETRIMTDHGPELVISVDKTGIYENMFDVTVESPNHRFYTNGVLSHNTTTVAALLLWYVLFNEDFSIAVLAHKKEQSLEIMSRIQLAFEMLPLWLQQGIKTWNKGDMEFENGSKIEAEATSSGAIRGRTYNIVYLDELAHIEPNVQEDFFTSTYPVITSGNKTKILITTTPKGLEYFYSLWKKSEAGKNNYVRVEAHWWDIPGRTEKWKKETIANTSERQFQQEFECVDGDTLVTVRDPLSGVEDEMTIRELYDWCGE